VQFNIYFNNLIEGLSFEVKEQLYPARNATSEWLSWNYVLNPYYRFKAPYVKFKRSCTRKLVRDRAYIQKKSIKLNNHKRFLWCDGEQKVAGSSVCL